MSAICLIIKSVIKICIITISSQSVDKEFRYNNSMKYIIKTEGSFGEVNIGEGASPAAAWEDAYGRKPWSTSTKRAAKNAWCEKIESDEEVSYSGY